MSSQPRVADVFAGVGGCSLAASLAGCRPVWACEWDRDAADVYEHNHGHRPAGDIWHVDPDDVPDHDILLAGVPCQGFSFSGDHLAWDDPREWVLHPLLRLLAARRPAAVVVENVRGLLESSGGANIRFLMGCLRALGYRVRHGLLNATSFGGSQFRERVFVVGSRRGRAFNCARLERKPPGKLADILDKDVPECEWLDPSRYVLLDTPTWTKNGMGFKGYLSGKRWRLGDGDPSKAKTHLQMSRIYSCDGVGPTLMTQSGRYWVSIGRRVRRVTTAECVRLMGYPDSFRWPHPARQRHQLGNSVHVPTVEAVIRGVVEQLL